MSKKPYDAEEVIDALLDRWSTVRRERDAAREELAVAKETRDYAEKDAASWKDAQAAVKAQARESMAILNALKDALGCYAGELVGKVAELQASKRAAPTVEEMDRFVASFLRVGSWSHWKDTNVGDKEAFIASVWGAP